MQEDFLKKNKFNFKKYDIRKFEGKGMEWDKNSILNDVIQT